MNLKLMTAWICPTPEQGLPQAHPTLQATLEQFYQAFPEYTEALSFSQSPRYPGHAFVYVAEGCNGLLPDAGAHLCHLLREAFPEASVRPYGKVL